MVWNPENLEGNANVQVTLKKDGQENVEQFAGTTILRDALRSVTSKYHVGNFEVFDSRGNPVREDMASSALSAVGNLTIVPKAVAAKE